MKIKIIPCLLAISLMIPRTAMAAVFPDVPTDHPQNIAIEALYNWGIINGYQDGTFGPNNPVRRAEALKMILNSALIPVPDLGNQNISFPDVKKTDWFASFVVAGVKNGVVNGNADGTFAPMRGVSRSEFVKMLLESFGENLSAHQNKGSISADTVAGEWFIPYLSYAKTIGIINPTLDNLLLPGKALNRAECAEMIYKMIVVKKGGDVQKLLSIAEAQLVDLLVQLNGNNMNKALVLADSAVFYTEQALAINTDNIVKGANAIAKGFRSLVLAYQAGVEQDYDEVRSQVTAANDFAQEAYSYADSLADLKSKIEEMGDVLVNQIEE